MAKRSKDNITLGSGIPYIMEYTGEMPTVEEICVEENRLGYCKGGAELSYTEETYEEIFLKATEERELEVDEYVKKVFFGNRENEKIIEMKIDECLVGWKKERVSYVAKAVLKLATYELMFMEDIPVKVSINEAIELSKKYDDDKAYVFVNGVLNKVADSIGRK